MNPQTNTLIDQDVDVRMPSMYAVVFHNDDTTSMDFVVEVLVHIFHLPVHEASAIMMNIHEKGHGVAGVYVYDIAATKKSQTDRLSAERGFPLKLTIREVA